MSCVTGALKTLFYFFRDKYSNFAKNGINTLKLQTSHSSQQEMRIFPEATSRAKHAISTQAATKFVGEANMTANFAFIFPRPPPSPPPPFLFFRSIFIFQYFHFPIDKPPVTKDFYF